MKKNITVNLFGSLYHIDEDAYRLLDAYLTNTRDCFSRQPDGREIADDIEARVAELMSEIRASGADTICIADVEAIIGRIGSPEELGGFVENEEEAGADTASASAPETTAEQRPRRKLFRDTQHRILGGVMAGLANYLNVNVLWLRIAALIVEFLFVLPGEGFFILPLLAYVACWLLIPGAKTPAERLQMKGEPVNLVSLRDEFLKGARDVYGSIDTRSGRAAAARGVSSLLRSLAVLAVIGLVVASAIGMFVTVFWATCFFSLPDSSAEYFFGKYSVLYQVHAVCSPAVTILFIAGLMVSLAVILFLGIHWLMRKAGRASALRGWVIWGVIALLTASMLLAVASWARIIADVSISHERFEPDYRAEREMTQKRHLDELSAEGWELVRSRNLSDGYMGSGEHYSGRKHLKYLNAANRTGSMDYEVVRTVHVAPGTYELQAMARTDGRGCELFAVNGAGRRWFAAVKPCGGKGGDVWADAVAKVRADSTQTSADYQLTKRMADANDGQGFGWQRVVAGPVSVGADSVLTYGVTNLSPTTVWDGTFLSATAFELRRL